MRLFLIESKVCGFLIKKIQDRPPLTHPPTYSPIYPSIHPSVRPSVRLSIEYCLFLGGSSNSFIIDFIFIYFSTNTPAFPPRSSFLSLSLVTSLCLEKTLPPPSSPNPPALAPFLFARSQPVVVTTSRRNQFNVLIKRVSVKN